MYSVYLSWTKAVTQLHCGALLEQQLAEPMFALRQHELYALHRCADHGAAQHRHKSVHDGLDDRDDTPARFEMAVDASVEPQHKLHPRGHLSPT